MTKKKSTIKVLFKAPVEKLTKEEQAMKKMEQRLAGAKRRSELLEEQSDSAASLVETLEREVQLAKAPTVIGKYYKRTIHTHPGFSTECYKILGLSKAKVSKSQKPVYLEVQGFSFNPHSMAPELIAFRKRIYSFDVLFQYHAGVEITAAEYATEFQKATKFLAGLQPVVSALAMLTHKKELGITMEKGTLSPVDRAGLVATGKVSKPKKKGVPRKATKKVSTQPKTAPPVDTHGMGTDCRLLAKLKDGTYRHRSLDRLYVFTMPFDKGEMESEEYEWHDDIYNAGGVVKDDYGIVGTNHKFSLEHLKSWCTERIALITNATDAKLDLEIFGKDRRGYHLNFLNQALEFAQLLESMEIEWLGLWADMDDLYFDIKNDGGSIIDI